MEERFNEDNTAQTFETEPAKPVRLSLHIIVSRNLPREAESWLHDHVIEALNKITHLRLDREHISEIDSLELLGSKVTNVYLQQNCIKRIQNLDCLRNLTFLTLAGNRIQTVENLQPLTKLLFLDLSDNAIEDFDIDEFPQSLIILNLEGNPCCSKQDYRGRIIQDLAALRQLDGVEISKQEKLEVGFKVSSSESEDTDDWEGKENADKSSILHEESEGGRQDPSLRRQFASNISQGENSRPKLPDIEVRLRDVANEMLQRSQNRLEETLQTYRQHKLEMSNLGLKYKAFAAKPGSSLTLAAPILTPDEKSNNNEQLSHGSTPS